MRLGAHLELFTDLCRWTEREGVTPAGLDSGQVAAFLADRRRRGRRDLISPAGARALTGYLAGAGAIPGQRPVIPEGPAREVLERYRRYLEAERGLTEKTIRRYAGIAGRFAAGLERDGEISWQGVRARDVTRFLLRSCPQRRSGHAPEAVSALRSFLRFCHLDGVTPSALDGAVPAAAGKRISPLPKGIPDGGLGRLLASCDRERPRGRRDYAILLLLARLGLRAGEVAAMTLDDIDWRRGELAVRGKARREEVLPLPDVGGAIAGYLRSGRPQALLAQAPDVVREMLRAFAQQVMDAEAEAACGPATGRCPRSGSTPATAAGAGSGTPGPGRVELAIPGCGTAATFRRSWSTAAGPSGRWPPSWRRRTCWASPRGGWRSSRSRWA